MGASGDERAANFSWTVIPHRHPPSPIPHPWSLDPCPSTIHPPHPILNCPDAWHWSNACAHHSSPRTSSAYFCTLHIISIHYSDCLVSVFMFWARALSSDNHLAVNYCLTQWLISGSHHQWVAWNTERRMMRFFSCRLCVYLWLFICAPLYMSQKHFWPLCHCHWVL